MQFAVRGLAALSLAFAALGAQSAVIDFGNGPTAPNYCADNVAGTGAQLSCADWSYINQGYGDAAGVDVTYSHGILDNTSLRWWAANYNDLYGVLFADGGDGPGSHAVIELKAVGGSTITLEGFDLGSYNAPSRGTIVDIYDIGTGLSVYHYAGSVGNGAAHTSFDFDLSSTAGLRIEFQNTAYNVGIDNIAYTVTAVPEPETLALMLAGIAAVGAVARRRRA